MHLIDAISITQFIRSGATDWAWLLQHIESEDGHVRFPPQVNRAILNLKIESYPLLYENEAAIGLVVFRAFMTHDEMVELDSNLAQQSPEQRGETLREMLDGLSQFDGVFEIPKTPAEEKHQIAVFMAMSVQDQAEAVKTAQHLWMGFLAGFFQNLSVMVHGEKLTSLVLVHHTGKDSTRGLRGHSSLFAAMDAAVEVSRDGDRRERKVAKSKDGADGDAQPQTINLPNGSLTDQGRVVLAAVAAGELAPGQGAQLLAAIGTLSKVAELDELSARITALEEKHA